MLQAQFCSAAALSLIFTELGNEPSSVGHVIAHKNITVGNEPRPLVVVAIRGTAHIFGWITNIHAITASGNDDLGFNGAANMVGANLKDYIDGRNLEDPIVLITGHSKGASVSNVLADKLNRVEDAQLDITPSNVYAYTFATLNVSKKISTTYANIFNILNEHDFFVNLLPNWEKHGLDGIVSMDDMNRNNILTSHQMSIYMNWMEAQDSELTWVDLVNLLLIGGN